MRTNKVTVPLDVSRKSFHVLERLYGVDDYGRIKKPPNIKELKILEARFGEGRVRR